MRWSFQAKKRGMKMSKFELREVTYEINKYMPNFKIIDNDSYR